MPLIKADQSVAMFKEAIVLNMNDVTEQAAQIKASAEQTAEKLISEARAKAQKVTDDHAEEGFEKGYSEGFAKGQSEGFEKGHAEGLANGHAEAVANAKAQFDPLVTAWGEAGRAWDEYHSQLDLDARDSVIELALRLAEKILHRQLQVDSTVIVDQVTAALKNMTGATSLSIHVNPQDRAVMLEVMPQLIESFGQFKSMRVVDDPNIGRGGCILVHEHGRLNATLETQLRRAVELLLPGDYEMDPLPQETAEEPDKSEQQVQEQAEQQDIPEDKPAANIDDVIEQNTAQIDALLNDQPVVEEAAKAEDIVKAPKDAEPRHEAAEPDTQPSSQSPQAQDRTKTPKPDTDAA
ncbi:MAG: FliH/SctL family protein [Phycisphaeraceae bacterium JB051]